MKKSLIIASTSVFALTCVSAFMWAGFDYSWWTPMQAGSGRGPALWFVHFIGLVQLAIVLGLAEAESTRAPSRTSSVGVEDT